MSILKRIVRLEEIHSPEKPEHIVIGNPEIGDEMISFTVGGDGKSKLEKFKGYRPGDTIVHTTPPNGELGDTSDDSSEKGG